jgi:hypothetical protein
MSERMKVASDALLSVLRSCSYPNCTLYLIWHYMSRGRLTWHSPNTPETVTNSSAAFVAWWAIC